jgi:hypothetical protein
MTDLARMGDNIDAPYAQGVADRLEADYAELLSNAKDTLADAEELPQSVETSIDMAAVADVAKKIRDLAARAESHRVAEKEPYLRAGDAVQAFFMKRVIEPLNLKYKNLTLRLDAFKQRQLAEERARREAEAAAARRQQQEAQRQREEAEAAARRARSTESVKLRSDEAARARVEENMAAAKTEETTLATMQKAGRMVGERFEGDRSGKVSMRKVPVVFIDDVAKLDLELLRPYLKEEHLLTALRQWAKATNYQQEMPGATVAQRDATVVI